VWFVHASAGMLTHMIKATTCCRVGRRGPSFLQVPSVPAGRQQCLFTFEQAGSDLRFIAHWLFVEPAVAERGAPEVREPPALVALKCRKPAIWSPAEGAAAVRARNRLR
jgi:hypothetical protein